MKKTKLIKNAINQRVAVEILAGRSYRGWLVPDDETIGTYVILPFDEVGYDNVLSFRVSHIKHLTYIDNGHRLW